jgi:hypothetical protein
MMSETRKNEYPKSWPLRCPECRDRIQVELAADAPEGTTGSVRCRRGHELLFGYDGVTVVRLDEALILERR